MKFFSHSENQVKYSPDSALYIILPQYHIIIAYIITTDHEKKARWQSQKKRQHTSRKRYSLPLYLMERC